MMYFTGCGVIDLSGLRENGVVVLLELVVDQDDALGGHQHGHVAAVALDFIQVVVDLVRVSIQAELALVLVPATQPSKRNRIAARMRGISLRFMSGNYIKSARVGLGVRARDGNAAHSVK